MKILVRRSDKHGAYILPLFAERLGSHLQISGSVYSQTHPSDCWKTRVMERPNRRVRSSANNMASRNTLERSRTSPGREPHVSNTPEMRQVRTLGAFTIELHRPVAKVVAVIFAFANAGVSSSSSQRLCSNCMES